eukprot:gene11734-12805_t
MTVLARKESLTTKKRQSCLFCRIHQREEPGVIIFEDEEFVVFQPRSPVTRFHYLVTPRHHINDLSSITFSKQILQSATFLYRLKQAAMKATSPIAITMNT